MALLNFPDPSVIQTYTANGNSWEWNGTSWISANNLDLANQVSGVLGTVYGGTGKALSGMTVGSVIYADTSSSFAALAPGTNNYVLATQGSGAAPYWKIDDSGTGSVGNGTTGGFAYYTGLNSITSGSGVSYISASSRIVLTSQILSLPSSVIDSGVWAGTAISLANGGTNGNRSGIGISYELAVYNAAGTAITQIDTTSSIGNSVLLQVNQTVMPTWVGQSSLSVGSATTATTAGSAGTSVTAGSAGTSVSAGTAGTATNAGSAGTSVTAGSATTATNAGFAGAATTATSAGSAGTSVTAGSAGTAVNAGSATTATNAGFAGAATTATNAGFAGAATTATSAGSAGTSVTAGSAGTAVNAGSATTATNAGFAGAATTATNAGFAGAATTATSAGSAGTSVTSGSAGTAVNAGSATTATNAGFAGAATTATSAGTAGTATNAGSAGTAVNAGSAGTSTNAGRAEGIRTQTFSGTDFLALLDNDNANATTSIYSGSGISVQTNLFVISNKDTILGFGTNSTNTTTGALRVVGGLGVSGSLNVGGNFVLTGDLTVNGTTTTVNSTVSTVVDPIITIGTGIGGTVPNSADSKDRGVAFYYFSGTGKTGFFGWDQSASKYALFTDATISGEVVNGTKGTLVADLDGNAGTATTANTAGSAGTSVTAGSAGTSVTAGSATTATNAGFAGAATTATSAGTAGTATNAGSAGTSVTAGSAGTSVTAGSATTATNAGFAGAATTATSAGSAGTSVTAGSAGTSVTAGSATTATNAGFAGAATTATNAGFAGAATTATNAGSAGTSVTAGSATTATNAGFAGAATTATSAGTAGTATNAGSAGTSVTAGSAGTATNAGLAQKLNIAQFTGAGTSFLVFSDVINGTASLGATGFIKITASTGAIGASSYTGTWAGNAITALYGGTGLNAVSKLNVLTGASSGNSWIAIGSSTLPVAYISDNAPAALTAFGATQPGQLWWDSTYGVLKVFYSDTNTSQWVDALPVLGSNGGSAVKRSYLLSFGAGFTPSLGADSVSIMIPYAPDNTSLNYYIKRLDYRNETVSSGAGVSFYIERNTTQNPSTAWTIANTIHSAAGSSFKTAGIYITSYTLAGSGASFVSSAGVAASVMSGDYLRLNFTALNGAATLAVSMIIEQQ
jgi:hypothetical protein